MPKDTAFTILRPESSSHKRPLWMGVDCKYNQDTPGGPRAREGERSGVHLPPSPSLVLIVDWEQRSHASHTLSCSTEALQPSLEKDNVLEGFSNPPPPSYHAAQTKRKLKMLMTPLAKANNPFHLWVSFSKASVLNMWFLYSPQLDTI